MTSSVYRECGYLLVFASITLWAACVLSLRWNQAAARIFFLCLLPAIALAGIGIRYSWNPILAGYAGEAHVEYASRYWVTPSVLTLVAVVGACWATRPAGLSRRLLGTLPLVLAVVAVVVDWRYATPREGSPLWRTVVSTAHADCRGLTGRSLVALHHSGPFFIEVRCDDL